MSKPFFICGIPRTRTAWFSVVATTQKSCCLHEPVADLPTFDALRELWADDRFEHVGIADSGLTMQLGRILREIAPRTLMVERDPVEAARSFDLYVSGSEIDLCNFKTEEYCRSMQEELLCFREHPLVRCIDFDDLHDIGKVREALQWLMPNVTCHKLEEMMHMNVQVDRDWVIQKAKQPHTNWHLDTSWRDDTGLEAFLEAV